MHAEWLTKRTTVAEVEAANMVQDKTLGPKPVPFGFIYNRWREFIGQMQPGDELWEFRSPPETWRMLAGRAGFAIVRKGELIDSLITCLN